MRGQAPETRPQQRRSAFDLGIAADLLSLPLLRLRKSLRVLLVGWIVSLSLSRQSPDGKFSPRGGEPAADAVPPSEGKVSPFARCARQPCSFPFVREDAMLEALGILMVALAFLVFLSF